MDEILSETMSRLRKRQETSRSTKASKLSQIDSLNQKIAKLKEQVARLKDEVAALESEDAKIEANVVALENMKSIPSEITEVDMESHKQKRVIRAKKARRADINIEKYKYVPNPEGVTCLLILKLYFYINNIPSGL